MPLTAQTTKGADGRSSRADHARRIAAELSLKPSGVAAAISLLDDGNTLPFVARYRKEATGNLDEESLRAVAALAAKFKALDERRQTILDSLREHGHLTDELARAVAGAETLTELEDLYQPYRPKRRTRASMARERGLSDLAELILAQPDPGERPETVAAGFLSDEVPDVDAALAGARDIVAETISDDPRVRGATRQRALRWALVRSVRRDKADDPRDTFKLYYEFDLRIDRVRPHQVLALNRGEAEGILRVGVDVAERDWRDAIGAHYRPRAGSPFASQLSAAIDDAAARLLLPAIERDVRRSLTEQAEAHAVRVFADNLRALLLQPTLADHTVMGIDPGFRTGCKVAIVAPTSQVLATATVYPHAPQNRKEEAAATLARLIDDHGVTLIAIGNGTASRETEALAAELTRDTEGLHYLIVSEAGASVYSASPLARAELPELDVSLRGAVSIARRAQDPMAELVKIDPRSIGVGLYQHDIDQGQLSSALEGVVESVVNRVGVDLNTASPALLGYVAGVGPKLAEGIVEHRDSGGPFATRRDLLRVAGVGPKTFEQAAGFLRVRAGDNPLDASAIHPESYAAATQVLALAGLEPSDIGPGAEPAIADLRQRGNGIGALSSHVGVGEATLRDILEQLTRPGRDPREDVPPPLLRQDVLSMEDLSPGMRLAGTVRNVVDFGAFVDIGVKQDGLLHRSQIPRNRDLSVGDVIDVAVLKVEAERGRIGLGWPEA